MQELVNRKLGWCWYVKELHLVRECTCSYCDKARQGFMPWRIWKPSLRYWLAGWWALVRITQAEATYWRITLL